MSMEISNTCNNEAKIPSPQMLHRLAKAAFAYGDALGKTEVSVRRSIQPIYYLKDFQLRNNERIGRIARFTREPLLEVIDDDQCERLTGMSDAYSFYYSERIEHEDHSLREEWQAYGYRWDDNDGVLRAARWVENHPSLGQRRSVTESTASDVDGLIREFQIRQQEAQKAA